MNWKQYILFSSLLSSRKPSKIPTLKIKKEKLLLLALHMNMPMQWQKNMQLLDANVILRYLLNDHEEMPLKASDIIFSGIHIQNQKLFLK